MKIIAEMIRGAAYVRLKERYGELVDRVFVKELGVQMNRSFEMKFQMFNWKRISTEPTETEIDETLGRGVAEMENALYRLLNFGEKKIEQAIHLNHNLPKNGIHMHPTIYAELMKSERESMRKIEERLEQLNERKGR